MFSIEAELGKRQRDHVFRPKIVGYYCIMFIFVVAYNPFRHRDLNVFCVFFRTTEALLSCRVLQLSRCREAKSIVACPALHINKNLKMLTLKYVVKQKFY